MRFFFKHSNFHRFSLAFISKAVLWYIRSLQLVLLSVFLCVYFPKNVRHVYSLYIQKVSPAE